MTLLRKVFKKMLLACTDKSAMEKGMSSLRIKMKIDDKIEDNNNEKNNEI